MINFTVALASWLTNEVFIHPKLLKLLVCHLQACYWDKLRNITSILKIFHIIYVVNSFLVFLLLLFLKLGSHLGNELYDLSSSPAINLVGGIKGSSPKLNLRWCIGRWILKNFDIHRASSWPNHMSLHLCRKKCMD